MPSVGQQLIAAVGAGRVGEVQTLIAARANVEESLDMDGYTPLFVAVCEGHAEVVQVLLEAGASAEAKDKNGVTPLDKNAVRRCVGGSGGGNAGAAACGGEQGGKG